MGEPPFTLRLTIYCALKQMPTRTQAKKAKPRLCKKSIRIALATRDWSQADLANAIGKSLTAVNLTINHGMFPDITDRIRKELGL